MRAGGGAGQGGGLHERAAPRQVPPNLHFKELNPHIDLDDFSCVIPVRMLADAVAHARPLPPALQRLIPHPAGLSCPQAFLVSYGLLLSCLHIYMRGGLALLAFRWFDISLVRPLRCGSVYVIVLQVGPPEISEHPQNEQQRAPRGPQEVGLLPR